MVALTDINTWKNFLKECVGDGRLVVWNLINWIANRNAGLYSSVRQYIMTCNSAMNRKNKAAVQTDETFIITASAITMVLRPFHSMPSDLCESVFSISNQTNCLEGYDAGVKSAAEQFCVYILTIPYLTQRLPAALLPALQHSSTFSPCLRTMVVMADFKGSYLLGNDKFGSTEADGDSKYCLGSDKCC